MGSDDPLVVARAIEKVFTNNKAERHEVSVPSTPSTIESALHRLTQLSEKENIQVGPQCMDTSVATNNQYTHISHVAWMLENMKENMEEGSLKLTRWLGYAEGVLDVLGAPVKRFVHQVRLVPREIERVLHVMSTQQVHFTLCYFQGIACANGWTSIDYWRGVNRKYLSGCKAA